MKKIVLIAIALLCVMALALSGCYKPPPGTSPAATYSVAPVTPNIPSPGWSPGGTPTVVPSPSPVISVTTKPGGIPGVTPSTSAGEYPSSTVK